MRQRLCKTWRLITLCKLNVSIVHFTRRNLVFTIYVYTLSAYKAVKCMVDLDLFVLCQSELTLK